MPSWLKRTLMSYILSGGAVMLLFLSKAVIVCNPEILGACAQIGTLTPSEATNLAFLAWQVGGFVTYFGSFIIINGRKRPRDNQN